MPLLEALDNFRQSLDALDQKYIQSADPTSEQSIRYIKIAKEIEIGLRDLKNTYNPFSIRGKWHTLKEKFRQFNKKTWVFEIKDMATHELAEAFSTIIRAAQNENQINGLVGGRLERVANELSRQLSTSPYGKAPQEKLETSLPTIENIEQNQKPSKEEVQTEENKEPEEENLEEELKRISDEIILQESKLSKIKEIIAQCEKNIKEFKDSYLYSFLPQEIKKTYRKKNLLEKIIELQTFNPKITYILFDEFEKFPEFDEALLFDEKEIEKLKPYKEYQASYWNSNVTYYASYARSFIYSDAGVTLIAKRTEEYVQIMRNKLEVVKLQISAYDQLEKLLQELKDYQEMQAIIVQHLQELGKEKKRLQEEIKKMQEQKMMALPLQEERTGDVVPQTSQVDLETQRNRLRTAMADHYIDQLQRLIAALKSFIPFESPKKNHTFVNEVTEMLNTMWERGKETYHREKINYIDSLINELKTYKRHGNDLFLKEKIQEAKKIVSGFKTENRSQVPTLSQQIISLLTDLECIQKAQTLEELKPLDRYSQTPNNLKMDSTMGI